MATDPELVPSSRLRTPPPLSTRTQAFPLIEIAGDARTRGREYGLQAMERIHRCIEIYKAAFEYEGVLWAQARKIAGAFLPKIESYSSDIATEMRAIAAGADVSVEDIIAINARTELLYGQHGAARKRPEGHRAADADGCTGAIALPESTASGHMLHGQNWDWRDECADCAVVLFIAPDEGPRILCFVEAGMMARAGMNSDGVAITGNFLECEHDARREGIPVPIIRRQVLMSRDLAGAVQVVLQAERAFSNNLMLSQCAGEAIDLEATPDEVFWMAPQDGILVHANHFVTAAARAKVRDTGLYTNGDSLYRDRRVRAYLDRMRGRITLDTLKAAFQDRYGSPRAVCRTATEGPGGRVSSTVATILMDTTEGQMWIAPRPYGSHEFTEYRLRR